MALTVTISGGENIDQGEQVTLTAAVTDANGNTPPGTLEYEWTATRGSFVGATDEASAVYHADFTDTSTVPVTVTCEVTRPANATPTSAGPSLTALAEIGVTGILVNMFLTALGAVSSNTNNVLYNASTGALDASSDQRLASNINVYQLRWDNTNNNFVLNNDETGNIGTFFTGNNNQSVYIIFDDGTYIELTPSDFAAGTSRGQTWARWLVSDANILSLLNGLSTTDDLVVGVADAGAIGWDADSGSDTEMFTASAVIPLGIESIDEQFITIGTKDYVLEIDIYGDPDDAEADGLQEGFYQDWDSTNHKLKIKADIVTRLITAAEWTITAKKGSQTITSTIIYNVVPAVPIIVDPGQQTLYKGIPFERLIEVANLPTIVRGRSKLSALKYTPETNKDGDFLIKTAGTLPAGVNLAFNSFDASYHAENEGGSDDLNVPFLIKDASLFGLLHNTSNLLRLIVWVEDDTSSQLGTDFQLATVTHRQTALDKGFLALLSDAGATATIRLFRIVATGLEEIGTTGSEGLEPAFEFADDRWADMDMAGSKIVSTNWVADTLRYFDVSDDGITQDGTDVSLGTGNWNRVFMSDSIVIAAHNPSSATVAKIFKVFNASTKAQIGSDVSASPDGHAAGLRNIAIDGSRWAALIGNTSHDQSQARVYLYDSANSNALINSKISLRAGRWYDIALSGGFIYVVGSYRSSPSVVENVVRVYDTNNNNSHVRDISISPASTLVEVVGNRVFVYSSKTIRVFNATTGAQVGSSISLGSSGWVQMRYRPA